MKRHSRSRDVEKIGFLKAVRINRELIESATNYPFSVPAIRHLDRLEFSPGVTVIIGENGVGKSTLIEAIAVKWGFNPEGGSKNFRFSTKNTHSTLKDHIVLEKTLARPVDGFFLRAETFYSLASEVDNLAKTDPPYLSLYGGKSLHEQSHGEAFLAFFKNRFGGHGLYIFDEPEAALSPKRQLSVLVLIHDLMAQGSQCIICTHSPILMGYPDALIYEMTAEGIAKVDYDQTDHVRLTRNFLNGRERMLGHLFGEQEKQVPGAEGAER